MCTINQQQIQQIIKDIFEEISNECRMKVEAFMFITEVIASVNVHPNFRKIKNLYVEYIKQEYKQKHPQFTQEILFFVFVKYIRFFLTMTKYSYANENKTIQLKKTQESDIEDEIEII